MGWDEMGRDRTGRDGMGWDWVGWCEAVGGRVTWLSIQRRQDFVNIRNEQTRNEKVFFQQNTFF